MALRILLACALAALPAAQAARAQGAEPPLFSGHAAARRFLAGAGAPWRVRMSPERGSARHVYGGHIAFDVDGSDASFEHAARTAVDDFAAMLGFDSDVLVLRDVKRIGLSRAGGSDKVAVALAQVVDGVAVHRGFVNVLFDAEGRLVSLDNQGLPRLEDVRLPPDQGVAAAADLAAETFRRDTARAVASIVWTDYVVYPAPVAPGRRQVRPLAAYLFRVDAPSNPAWGEAPVARSYAVAATGALRVLDEWNEIHPFDLTGTVQGWAHPGLLPATSEPHTLVALEDVRLTTAGQPAQHSAQDGTFAFPGVAASQAVTATLAGQWSSVQNLAGGAVSLTLTVDPGAPETFTFNETLTQLRTAQLNAHYHTNRLRRWLLAVDPGETILDFPVVSQVNAGATCNAFYTGSALQFQQAGYDETLTFCNNSAYATVVYHEEGHWLNALFDSGNGADGFGEGAADAWAMYVADDPLVGADFNGPGTFTRTGLNTRPFCGDEQPGCHGDIHDDGEVLMGALWKVRANLKASLGDAAGAALADALLLAWFQAYDDGALTTLIEEHWFVLDDDNGDLDDGTPHFPEIHAGFTAQGFPVYPLPFFEIAHAARGLVGHEGPVTIGADISSTLTVPDTVRVHYSTDGGQSYTAVPMTLAPPFPDAPADMIIEPFGEYEADIPGQASPAVVDYYIEVVDPDGITTFHPAAGAAAPLSYDVGVRTVLASWDFETADGADEGWTHEQLAVQDDWQRGTPDGDAGDPSAAFSGSKCWGNDLGAPGFNGAYGNNVSNRLLSPVVDLSAAEDVRLRLRRWLTVEDGAADHARILLDGALVWENPTGPDVLDTAWRRIDHDVSALADGNAAAQIVFELMTDGAGTRGGWNIDDVRLVSLSPLSAPAEYGPVDPGGLRWTGTGRAEPGRSLTLSLGGAPPGAAGLVVLGAARAGGSTNAGSLLADGPVVALPFTADAAGAFALPLLRGGADDVWRALPPAAPGAATVVTSQVWLLGPDGMPVAASNGVRFHVE